MKENKSNIGKIIFFCGLLVLSITLAKVFYFSAGAEDSGLPAAAVQSGEVSESELPSRLLIPKLNIDANVQHLGVTETGNMAAPKNFTDVSWYNLGTVPGTTGSAVMAGHEDNAISLDGVFKHLGKLEVGDDIYVVKDDGSRLHFRVIKEEVHPYDLSGAPLDKIFNDSSGKYLNLITCTGDWLPSAKTNDKRLIIFAKLVE